MSVGKYSPTVQYAYSENQGWFDQFSLDGIYDLEGYDSYGYNKNGVDRAGNQEVDYSLNNVDFDGDHPDYYLYDLTVSEWTSERILNGLELAQKK